MSNWQTMKDFHKRYPDSFITVNRLYKDGKINTRCAINGDLEIDFDDVNSKIGSQFYVNQTK